MPFDPTTASAISAPAGFDVASATAVKPAAAAPEPVGPDDDDAITNNKAYAFLHGAADTATFGLADKASAVLASKVLSPLTGKQMSYDEALARIRANASKAASSNPISAGAGDVAGLVAGGGVIGGAAKAAEALPVVGKAVTAAGDALKLQKGQGLRNIARAATVGGGTAAGFTAGREGVDAATGDGTGLDPDAIATSAAAGAIGGPIAGKVASGVARSLGSVSDKAMRLLASRLDETPAVLQTVFDKFQQQTGRVPTLAEIVNMKSQGELRKFAAENPTVADAVGKAEDTAAGQRQQSVAQLVENEGGPAQDISQLTQARKATMDASMRPIQSRSVPVDTTDIGLLTDPRVRVASRNDPELQLAVQDAVQEVGDNGSSSTLQVKHIDSIRRALRNQQSAMLNQNSSLYNPQKAIGYGNLADNIGQLGANAEPAYGDALEQFGRDSDYISGFNHGMKGKTVGEADAPELIRALDTPEGRSGHQAGIVTRTSNAASDSTQGAVSVARQLAAQAGNTAALGEAVGGDASTRLAAAGDMEAKGADSLRNISGGGPGATNSNMDASHAAHALGAAAGHSPTGILSHVIRALSGQKVPPAVQRKIAQYLADPSMTQQGVNLLRRAGLKNEEIGRLAQRIAASTGANASAELGN